jgi:DTW domain-containing protein YfiP
MSEMMPEIKMPTVRSAMNRLLRMYRLEQNPNDRARKTAEYAFNRLSAEPEAGKSEALKSYLAAMSQ